MLQLVRVYYYIRERIKCKKTNCILSSVFVIQCTVVFVVTESEYLGMETRNYWEENGHSVKYDK